jgi:hypothetical protein
MEQNRVDSGVTGQDLPRRASCGVPVENRAYIFAQTGKHEKPPEVSRVAIVKNPSVFIKNFIAGWIAKLPILDGKKLLWYRRKIEVIDETRRNFAGSMKTQTEPKRNPFVIGPAGGVLVKVFV